jgi:hypothetical protein
MANLRLSFRSLLRSPGYTAVAVLVLGFGIGVSVAVWAIAKQALLAPLPYRDAGRLVTLFETSPTGGIRLPSNPTVEDWKAQNDVFQSMAYVTGGQVLLKEPAGPELVTTAVPPGNFFSLMDARPVLGRTIQSDDDAKAERVVVLSHALWRRHPRTGSGGR